jgi:hypothetical protein
LSRENSHKIFGETVKAIREKDVTMERFAAVLSQDEDFSQPGMDAVADGNIDQTESARDRDCRFAPLLSEGIEAFALTTCEYYCDHIRHVSLNKTIEQRIIY